MKKVLSAFFAVFLSMTSGYCENTSFVDTNLSSYDSMNTVISIRAIYEAFKINKCFYSIQSDVKDKIGEDIAEIISEGASITLEYFFHLCTAVHKHKITLSDKDIPGYVENCIGCTIDIAEKHNELISKHEQKQINNIVVFTSEEEYNKVLKTKGYCTNKNTNKFSDITMTTRRSCEKFCRNMAITNACVLEGTYFYGNMCQCVDDLLSKGMSVRQWAKFKSYYVRPTWEDYKKLYNIK